MISLNVESTAREMVAAIRSREISARELLELHLARIAERNPQLNAIVSLDEERARSGAAEADAATARGDALGALHGLPFAFKDTHDVAGWRTTYGSPLFADHVPDADELIVERIRGASAVTIGKTNVPEFAAGSHTFNTVFGTTLNPVDPTRSAGGSSGGAACALRAGMVPLADGSDMGGSLRNPASFCGVVGLRPSLGRVPAWPDDNFWETTSTSGPLARNVDDLALLLSVVAGPDDRVPTALADPGSSFAEPPDVTLDGLLVALSPDLGGLLEVDTEVRRVVEEAGSALAGAGARVDAAHPDLTEADDTFRTLRAWRFQSGLGELLAAHPESFKPSLADNIRAGASLTGADVARGYAQRTALADRMRVFFGSYDVLVLPTSQVPPFPADQEYPHAINGRPMATYLDWMRSAYVITVDRVPGHLGARRSDAGGAAGRRSDRGSDRLRCSSPRHRAGLRTPRRGRVGVHSTIHRPPGQPVEDPALAVDDAGRFCGGRAGTHGMSKKSAATPCVAGASGHRTSPTHFLRGERDRSETKICTTPGWLATPGSRWPGDGATGVGGVG